MTVDAPELRGGCQCGAIRYRVSAATSWVGHCHCSMCRRSAGAAYVTWFTVPAAAVAWERQSPARFGSSAIAERGHCPNCGAQILWQGRAEPLDIDLTLATLDDPGALRPLNHLFWNDRVPGVEFSDGLPRHAGDRGSPRVTGP